MKPTPSADSLDTLVSAVLAAHTAQKPPPLGVDANLYRAWCIGNAIQGVREGAGKASADESSRQAPRFDYQEHVIVKLATITSAEIGVGRVYLYRAISATKLWPSELDIPRGIGLIALHRPWDLQGDPSLNLSEFTHREVIVRVADALRFRMSHAACEVPALWSALDDSGLGLGAIGIGPHPKRLEGVVIIGARCKSKKPEKLDPASAHSDARNPEIIVAKNKAKSKYDGGLEDRIDAGCALIADKISSEHISIGGVIVEVTSTGRLALGALHGHSRIIQGFQLPDADKIKAVLKSERWPLVPQIPRNPAKK